MSGFGAGALGAWEVVPPAPGEPAGRDAGGVCAIAAPVMRRAVKERVARAKLMANLALCNPLLLNNETLATVPARAAAEVRFQASCRGDLGMGSIDSANFLPDAPAGAQG